MQGPTYRPRSTSCRRRTAARASRHLGDAVRTYPPAAIDPKMPAALVGLTLGPRGRQALERVRYLVLRKGLRVHLRR